MSAHPFIKHALTKSKGIDNNATFAPVIQFDTLRLIVSLTRYLSLDTDSVHIKSAFLNVDRIEETCIIDSPGIVLDHMILGLGKAIYCIQQSSLP